jgi:hypothetical protein
MHALPSWRPVAKHRGQLVISFKLWRLRAEQLFARARGSFRRFEPSTGWSGLPRKLPRWPVGDDGENRDGRSMLAELAEVAGSAFM